MIEPGAVLRIALIALAGWVTAVWVCGAIYVAVSYVEAARFLPDRSLSDLLRAVLRESWLVLWTQPLLIWFQFFGRRLGSGGGVVPVVLVHGYFQNRVDFLYLARRLRAAGSGPLYACNFFWPQSLERSSVNVAGFVAQVCAETGATAVDLVTHSTGGLFALDLIAEQPHVVRRAALIALPARGVPWRGPVLGKSGSQLRTGSLYQTKRSTKVAGTPVVSIYSAHDNIVHPVQTSRLEGPVGHQRRDLRPRPPRGSVRPPSRRRGVRLPSRQAPIVSARYRRAPSGHDTWHARVFARSRRYTRWSGSRTMRRAAIRS